MKLQLEHCSARHPAARTHTPDALRGLSLHIPSGAQVAVIGPSGAGKTTLLHVLACALPPGTGQLALDNRNPWTLPRPQLQKLRGQLFLAPQVPPLPDRQRVVTAVLAARLPQQNLWASLRSLVYPSDLGLAEAALAHFDMADKLFDRVDRLSGGERQRVGLARALAAQARLFLVDEPLSALDPTRAEQAITSLTQAAGERGATLVATLHHVEMALRHFKRVIALRDGELVFDLPAAQVSPAHLENLYAQHLDELYNPNPPPNVDTTPAAATVIPAQCH